MKSFSAKAIRTTTALLVLLFLAFSFCGCAWRSRNSKYLLNRRFPNTIWTCRELDLVIYMIEGCDMCGTYTVNGNEYRVKAVFSKSEPAFFADFYSSTEETVSNYDSALVHCSQEIAGCVKSYVAYQENNGLLVCTDVSAQSVDGETIPDTLTFEQVGTFAPTPKTRWVAEGLDLYLDSYSDAEWFFKGEITLDGEKQTVQAIEIGNDHYYQLWEEGDVLIYLSFDISEDRIVATATDSQRRDDYQYMLHYPDWYDNYKDVKTITFYPTPIE